MFDNTVTSRRLDEMMRNPDPINPLWPENCAGSRRALVIFVGPSPGGVKEERREIVLEQHRPLWNEVYRDPLSWGGGFRNFGKIVEALFGEPYETSGKLIARCNLDWIGSPEARDVAYHEMWAGRKHVLRVIRECDPELLIPMDEKSFAVIQIALANKKYEIFTPRLGDIKIKISDHRFHQSIKAFTAEKDGTKFLVVKSPQHPSRIFNPDYARRVGQSIREAAMQMRNGNDSINLNI